MPIKRNCMQCGNEFTTYLSTIKRGGGKFCSRFCFDNHPQKKRINYGGKDPVDRFFEHIDKTSSVNGCWIWKGHINKAGYGRIRRDHKDMSTHRYSWLIHNGDIPKNMFICHKCDNPICCNPEHLFLGTPKDNSQDRKNKKRNRDQNGSKHNFAKLNESQVLTIRNRLKNGEVGRHLAKEYSVHVMTISNIKNRKKWTHI